ncbi:MAG: response regulator [Actinomycetia bacterium]|nr:response regulator [Actinomycetes bacterium]
MAAADYSVPVEAVGAMVLVLDAAGRIGQVNNEVECITGFARTSLVGRPVWEVFAPPGLPDQMGELVPPSGDSYAPVRGENEWLTASGDTRVVSWSRSAVPDGLNPAGTIVVTAVDVTEDRQAVRQGELRAAQLQSMLEAFPDVLYRISGDGTVLEITASAEAKSIWTAPVREKVGRRVTGLFPGEVGDRLMAGLRTAQRHGSVESVSYTLPGLDGLPVHRETRIAPLGNGEFVGVVRVVTERVRLQNQLVHTEKMQTLGRLAGGIAHDFNNVLAVVLGNAELLAADRSMSDGSADRVAHIRTAATSAADLVADLMALARPNAAGVEVLDVNRVVEDLRRSLTLLVGENIQVNLEPTARLSAVRIDQSHLEQVFLNLATNARDAMTEGGVFGIRSSDGEEGLVVEVNDTGNGMDAETRSQVFEPFFSTKDHGVGAGLGLATSYSTITQAGGSISVASAPGRGTTFIIGLPVVESPISAGRSEGASAEPTSGGGTILLVEDEPAVLALVAEILRRAGHDVLEASSGSEAVAVAALAGAIDLLVTDVVLGGPSGLELAARLREERPELPVLFVSGYAAISERDHGPDEDRHFLRKPFTRQQIEERVSELLVR